MMKTFFWCNDEPRAPHAAPPAVRGAARARPVRPPNAFLLDAFYISTSPPDACLCVERVCAAKKEEVLGFSRRVET